MRALVACAGITSGLIAATGIAAPAQAQMGMGMGAGAGMGMEGLSKRALNTCATMLGLDKDQKEAAIALLEGNQAARKQLMKDFQARMQSLNEKARDDGDFSVYSKEMPKMIEEQQEKAKKLESGFLDELKATLTPAQMEKWPKVERFTRREKGLKIGVVSGQSVDLIDALDRIKADRSSNKELVDMTEQYESSMDNLLKQWEKIGEDSRKKSMEVMGKFDPAAIEEAIKPVQDHAKIIRDLNREYERKMKPLLPEEKRDEFAMEIKKHSFPSIYRASHAQKSLDAALKLTDLNATQKGEISTLKSSYVKDVGPINDKWAQAKEEKEDKAGGRISAMMQSFSGQGGGDNAVSTARKARKELDEKTLTRLRETLKPDQASKLPEKPADPMMGWGENDMMPVEEDGE